MEAIESFAADVSHELKNPLTSLRSAVETLPIAKEDEQRARLLRRHQARREAARPGSSPTSRMPRGSTRSWRAKRRSPSTSQNSSKTVVAIARETRVSNKRKIQLTLEPRRWGKDAF